MNVKLTHLMFSVIVGLTAEDETEYRGSVDEFVNWCHSFLQLNSNKSNEMIFEQKDREAGGY